MPKKVKDWKDAPCFYVSIIDGHKKAFAAGPFLTHEAALACLPVARDLGCKLDSRAWFYGWGTAKAANGLREGSLSSKLAESHPELNRGEWK